MNEYLTSAMLDTPLGPMFVVADSRSLLLLEFSDRKGFTDNIERLKKTTKLPIRPGNILPIKSIRYELAKYFVGTLREFRTPVTLFGTAFQQQVWQELTKIPCGQTRSYAQVAKQLNKPTAFRAVAMANSTNQLAIIVPCHRVISSSGELAGYAAGVERKKWLLEHEKNGFNY